AQVKSLSSPGPRLIVLPKWMVAGEPLHPGWVRKVVPFGGASVRDVLKGALAKDVAITLAKGKASVKLHALFEHFDGIAPGTAIPIESLQTIAGSSFEPDIVDDKGHAVLAQLRGTQIYVLADPDFLNNRALHDKPVARLALALVDRLRVGDKQ